MQGSTGGMSSSSACGLGLGLGLGLELGLGLGLRLGLGLAHQDVLLLAQDRGLLVRGEEGRDLVLGGVEGLDHLRLPRDVSGLVYRDGLVDRGLVDRSLGDGGCRNLRTGTHEMDSISHRKSSWDAPGPLVRPGGRLTGCTAASMASAVRSGWVVAGSGAAGSSALLPAQPMLFVCLGWFSAKQRTRRE